MPDPGMLSGPQALVNFEEITVNSSVICRTVWLATITVATVLVGGGHPTWAQAKTGHNNARPPRSSPSYRVAQATPSASPSAPPTASLSAAPTMAPSGPTPAVDMPSPAGEGELFPLHTDGDYSSTPSNSSEGNYWNEAVDGGSMMQEGDASAMIYGSAKEFAESCEEETDSSGDPAPVYSTGSWFAPGKMYWNLDSIWWTKSDPRAIAIAREGADVAFQYSTKDVHQHYTPGLRTTLGVVLGRDAGRRDHSIEAEFQGLLHWQASLGMVPQTNAVLNTQLNGGYLGDADSPINTNPAVTNSSQTGIAGDPVAGFSNASSQTYEYTSDLNTFSLNYRVRTRPGRDQMVMQPDGAWVRFGDGSRMRAGLAGLRVFMLNESAIYTSQGTQNGVAFSGTHRVDTDNTLIGPQYGFDFTTKLDDTSFGFRSRMGGLINFAGLDSTTNTVNGVASRSSQVSESQFSFLGDFGLFASYHVRPNFVVRTGYDVMFVSGLSLAAENISLLPTFPPQNVTGNVLLHGGSLGFEAYW